MTSPPPIDDQALPAGTLLGEFELLSVLGAGGMGIVYLAQDHSLQRQVALKEYMPVSLARRGEGMQVQVNTQAAVEVFGVGLRSFVNEARLLARFDHPALLKVHRFWEANGTAYMVMPLLQGRSLKSARQAMAQPPDEAWLRALLEPLLGAVAVLHDGGVFHRDIAPDNIQLLEGDRPVLMDFGAARHVLADRTAALTAILKPAYSPIEQYADEGQVKQGPWTDLYAVGATLHFLLLHRPPAAATARVLGDTEPPLASQALPGCSAAFLRCIDWMLRPLPDDRPRSVAELLLVLHGQADVPPWQRGPSRGAPVDLAAALAAHEAAPAPLATTQFRTELFQPRAPAAPPAAAAGARPAAAGPGGRWLDRARRWLGGSRQSPAALPQQGGAATPGAPEPGPTEPGPPDMMGAGQTVIVSRARLAPPPAVPPTGAGEATVILQPAGPRAGPGDAAPARPVTLTVMRSDVASFRAHVHRLQPGSTVVGRAPHAGLRLPDPLLSREHARIEFDAQGIRVIDLGSGNGSWVNGMALTPHKALPLHPGASVQFGATVLSLSLQDQALMPDLAGQLIDGRYRLLECLQSSPKGVVYRAEKQPAGVTVAVKILSPDYAGYPGYRERFAAEARIAASLQHPHVCRLDDFGETDLSIKGQGHRVPYSAYPILGGGSLAERVPEFGSLGLDTIDRWLRHAAEALAYAHAAGVVHGNLKPAALCFDRDSNLYLTDFALAGGADGGPALFGTPAYMAPEQWRGEPAVPATDQYALAAIAYHLLAGRKPFDGQEDPERRAINLAEGPPPAHQLALQRFKRVLSPGVSAALAKALAPEAADRHGSVLAFAQSLAQALRSTRPDRARQAFISYRREDSAILATFIADQLQGKHEISAFVDTQGLDGATRFPARIERAIQDCEVFICVLGADTLGSGHVLREIQQAHAAGKPMIPVFQEDYQAPDEAGLDPAVAELLQFDGIVLLDKRNVYIHQAVAELAQQVKQTLRRRPSAW